MSTKKQHVPGTNLLAEYVNANEFCDEVVVQGIQHSHGNVHTPDCYFSTVLILVFYLRRFLEQILVTDKKVDQVNDLIPLLEAMVQAKEPLFIVAEDVIGEALSALVVNKMRGVLDVVSGLHAAAKASLCMSNVVHMRCQKCSWIQTRDLFFVVSSFGSLDTSKGRMGRQWQQLPSITIRIMRCRFMTLS